MGFGATYELAIVLFVVVFGILFIELRWSFLYQPFLELTMFFGIVVFLLGLAKKSYDTLFSGVLLIIVALVMLAAMPGIVPTAPGTSIILNVTWPITALMTTFYSLGPIALGLLLLLLAWLLTR